MEQITYIKAGDYFIPDWKLPEETRPIGRWGRMHRDYLKEHNLTMATLAVQYSMTRQDVTNILNGKLKNPQANQFIARVIEDFKIR